MVLINVTLFVVVNFVVVFVDDLIIVAAVVAVVFLLFLSLLRLSLLLLLLLFPCWPQRDASNRRVQRTESRGVPHQLHDTSPGSIYISLRVSHETNLPEYKDEIGVIFIRFTGV